MILLGKSGGRDRDRTGDPLLAKQVLSQLSYTPTAGVPFILKHLPLFQKSNPPLSVITVPELCQNPRQRADSGTACPSFRWLGD